MRKTHPHLFKLCGLTACILSILGGCSFSEKEAWPPANAPVVRASHPADETFRRKNWRDAIHFEAASGSRTYTLGPLGDARALRMGILREGRPDENAMVRVRVGRKLIYELAIPNTLNWSDVRFDLSGHDPDSACTVTFDIADGFWVSPLSLVPENSPRPNVLVVVLDTLRSDHTSLYGYQRKTTPRLDALAAQGVTFDNMLSVSSWTRPSVATLLTGTYPGVHGARDYTDVVRSDVPRLAQVLKENGYQTYAFARNANVHPYWGIGNAFFNFGFFGLGETDENLLDTALRTFPTLKGETWFTYIHLLNPHGAYEPTSVHYGPLRGMNRAQYQTAFIDRLMSDDERYRAYARDGFGIDLRWYDQRKAEWGANAPEAEPLAEVIRASIDLYDSEILEADARFGAILDTLHASGQFENTMIILLSDHGEEFFEHGDWWHGKTVYQEGLRVPLAIRLPGNEHAGRRVQTISETVDIAPTILSYLGINSPAAMQGRNLLPFMAGEENLEHVGFASVFRESGPAAEFSAAKRRDLKVIVNHRESTQSWFDLANDPNEYSPLSSPPEDAQPLLDRIETIRFQKGNGLHLVFTSAIDDSTYDVYEGELTIDGLVQAQILYPDDLYSAAVSDNTLTFRIEMQRGETVLNEHRLTHAEIVIDAEMDQAFSLTLTKNGEPVESLLVPAEGARKAMPLAGALDGYIAPAALAAIAATPVDGNVHAWFILETGSISEGEMDAEMRDSLEAMGYL